MESISLKLPEQMLKASRRNAQAFRLSRAEYLRRAIEKMNTEAEAQLLAERMTRASLKVRRQSLEVNAEFSRIERDPHARSR